MPEPGDPPPDLQDLLTRNLPAIEGYLRLCMGPQLRSHESAADLAQSVAREALQALAEFEFRGEGPFRHWLFTRARHKLQEHVRWFQRERRDVRREQLFDPDAHGERLAAYRRLEIGRAHV